MNRCGATYTHRYAGMEVVRAWYLCSSFRSLMKSTRSSRANRSTSLSPVLKPRLHSPSVCRHSFAVVRTEQSTLLLVGLPLVPVFLSCLCVKERARGRRGVCRALRAYVVDSLCLAVRNTTRGSTRASVSFPVSMSVDEGGD